MKPLIKSMILYKRFEPVDSGRLGSPPGLMGPFANVSYWDRRGKRLNTRNMVGFRPSQVRGALSLCSHGYHAVELLSTHHWEGRGIWAEVELLLVKPERARDAYGKWVGRGFKIIRRVSRKELAHLRRLARLKEARA